MAAPGFPSLCQELSRMQIRVFQRKAAASELSVEAARLIHENLDTLQPTSANVPFIPLYLKACAALFQHSAAAAADDSVLGEVLADTSQLAKHYIGAQHGDVNEASSVLRSVITLDKSYGKALSKSGDVRNFFSPLVPLAFSIAFDKWGQQRVRPTTLSVLSLLSGANAVHGSSFSFPPHSHDMRGLLPSKSRMMMEAKLQRCHGARELLTALREMEFNRLDAGMCLHIMADAGFYDEDVCNRSCSAVHAAHAVVTSQQMCEVLYSLGVLQHRHVHAKFFSSLVDAKKCDAQAVLKHVTALAMLQQPPPSQRCLLDGIFLHALRTRPRKGPHRNADGSRRSCTGGDRRKAEDNPYPLKDSRDALSDAWYIDTAYALACVCLPAPRFQLMTARHVRRSVARMTTSQHCKLLYGIGSPTLAEAPADLQAAWASKIDRLKNILYMKLQDISPEDGPQVASALHYCGIHKHPSIPSVTDLHATGENPAEVILRAWARATPARILELTERIEPHHLHGDGQPARVAQLVSRVADSCGPSAQRDRYRFGPLLAAVDANGAAMSADEALRTLSALLRMDLAGHYPASLEALMETLWARRAKLSEDELHRCACIANSLSADIDVVERFRTYAADKAGG